jgi:hypothetical protein
VIPIPGLEFHSLFPSIQEGSKPTNTTPFSCDGQGDRRSRKYKSSELNITIMRMLAKNLDVFAKQHNFDRISGTPCLISAAYKMLECLEKWEWKNN